MHRAFTLAGMTLLATIAAAFTRDMPVPVAAAETEAAGAACPLTITKEKEAVLAFQKMMPVVRHPRCMNCHGGVNPLVPYAQGKHMGGFIDTTQIAHSSVQTIRVKCQECHSELEGWDTPGAPMHWVGKSTKEICMQFKRLSNDPGDFIGHITNEHGGVQFIETAFKGERALNDMAKDIPLDDFGIPFVPAPPPGSHADLIRDGTEWANAVGSTGWTATAACGCEVRANVWVGNVTATYQRDDEMFGKLRERATTTAFFEFDEELSRGVPEEYWQSTGGTITWSYSTFGGKCVGSASGSLPVGLGGDDNPMATLQFEKVGNVVRYNVQLGPWKDQYYKTVMYPCGEAGSSIPVLVPGAVSHWWSHAMEGVELTNDKVLEGSYEFPGPGGSLAVWTWHFERFNGPRPIR